jgi:hypothetical protein
MAAAMGRRHGRRRRAAMATTAMVAAPPPPPRKRQNTVASHLLGMQAHIHQLASVGGPPQEIKDFLDANGLQEYHGLFAKCRTRMYLSRMVRASQVKAAASRIPEFRKMTPEQHEQVAQAVKAGMAKK